MKNIHTENAKTILAVTVLLFSSLLLMQNPRRSSTDVASGPAIHAATEYDLESDGARTETGQPRAKTEGAPSNTPTEETGVNYAAEETKSSTPVTTIAAADPINSPFVKESVLGDSIVTNSNTKYPLRTYTTQTIPNDPAAEQWWTESLHLPQFWDENTGSDQTLLAIIDTGFALNHEEFAGRWHENSSEAGPTAVEAPSKYNCSDRGLPLDQNCNLIDDDYDGVVDNETGATDDENISQLNCSDRILPLDKNCNLIDDDGNGLIDDYRGWDFVSFDNSPQAGDIDPNGSGTRHGSYVTGVAAGNANNGVGVAGVNWSTKILPLQALADSGSGTSIGVARSIRYAVNQGADVISLSLGGVYPDSYTRIAIDEAVKAGIIVVAAAGNDGCDCVSYPANYPEVVAVGALNQSSERAYFSSYGDNLDIMAPGVGIFTASWTQSNQNSAYAGGIAGTSLATPLVSGIITSLVGAYPNASPTEIVAALHENANRLSITSTKSSTLGFGGADAFAAQLRMRTPLINAQLSLFSSVSSGGYLGSSSANDRLHQCQNGQSGTTPIYRMKKNSLEFFTSNDGERYTGLVQGYSASLLGYSCVLQDIDMPLTLRMINVPAEFGRGVMKF